MALPSPNFHDSDAAVVELLRPGTPLGIGDLAAKLGVTATAVRQRLERLMRAGLIERRAEVRPRGRPAHVYSLTESGRRLGGNNFRDLALVLWRELRAIREPAIRQGLLARIAASLAETYRGRVEGASAGERLASIAEILGDRDISCEVAKGPLPVLTTYSCPYPELAEQDRSICSAERLMLQELVGTAVQLSECRLDGASCCRFTATPVDSPADSSQGLERKPVTPSNTVRLTDSPDRSGAVS
ncbi:MAG: helix-turn-helix transcriptional regulator [Pirellulales bacterium]